MFHQPSLRGFTLVETLVATGVLITAIAGLAQLFILSVRFTRDSAQFGTALVAAQDKLEALRSFAFTYDDNGVAITDPRLTASPPAALAVNSEPYVDWLDAGGNPANAPGAAHVRRWRITEIPGGEPAAIAIDVCVFAAPALGHGPDRAEACLATVRVRQP